jgi:hypothetical protein
MCAFERIFVESGSSGCGEPGLSSTCKAAWRFGATCAVLAVLAPVWLSPRVVLSQQAIGTPYPDLSSASVLESVPPRVAQARRFLSARGWTQGRRRERHGSGQTITSGDARTNAARSQAQQLSAATWQPLGPTAVVTPSFGLVTGRVSALALDPSDATGNRLYVGTTGGGVWLGQDAGASSPSVVVFNPLTDSVGALSGTTDASISIGALTVQPGGTGVILAGTGDPNDALDSYYGDGILRSSDGGNTWSLISSTADNVWSFAGEGFAGFAWSTVNPQLVVAAVSQAYEGTLVNAVAPHESYQGLYYSSDGGATWNLATITDGAGEYVQGPNAAFAGADGNAATSVAWNPVRDLFVAAVRYHGYYRSTDGMTWTRMTAQPGANLPTALCPTNPGETGSIACPIFRGTLAVNPESGDTFAWTTDLANQDQGLWQDSCAISGGVCGNPGITFARQWNTTQLETNTIDGAATIANGDYTLALAAVPSQQDTLLLAGADDLWKCSLAEGCVWRNTTNATTCMSAQVGEYQHALAWSTANPLEIFVGNDSGLWRSTDAIGETGPVCAATDAGHFQNLNGSLGSLAEVVSMSASPATPYTMMAGLGVNGTAGVKSVTGPTANWPQILSGDGGPVAIDPKNTADWYVNNEAGVSIYLCDGSAACTPSEFGVSPTITDADVGGDGYTMPLPAPFLVDPLDDSQLLIGTCRVWRGPANGVGWSGSNAISAILDNGVTNAACSGDALIRSMAAMPLANGSEVVYVGMYGSLDGGANRAGHVYSAIFNPSGGGTPQWNDLSLNPVTNDTNAMNAFGLDISSIAIDPHDATGETVYVTVAGIPSTSEEVQPVYRTTDGGARWTAVTDNLPWSPANSVVVDPQDANTVYVATDAGVYFTTQIASCVIPTSACWSAFGTGLPEAPVIALTAFSASSSTPVLAAATYGRGIWQTGLWSASTGLTTATANPASLMFPGETFGTVSAAQTVQLTNTGNVALTPTAITMTGDFSETDDCVNAIIAAGASCAIQVTFTPSATGSRTGQMTIAANVYGGQLSVDLSGTGLAAGAVTLTPAAINFGSILVGTTSALQQVEAGNNSATAVSITGVTITSPFTIASNACGTSTLSAQADCQVTVAFAPTQSGAVAGTLTFTDGAGTQTVALTGTGAAAATDILNPLTLNFPATGVGQLSVAQATTLTNTGGLALTSIAISISGPFTQTNNCGTQLSGPGYCSINVVYAPNQLGSQTGTLTVSDAMRTQMVTLSGTGAQPAVLSVSPASLAFASQQVGVASPAMTLTVSNTGQAALGSIGFQIAGQAASSFSLGATNCPVGNGATLSGGSSCTVQVNFTAASTGGSAATLTVSTATPGVSPVTVPMTGTGQIASGLNVTPAQLNYGTVTIGQSSAAQAVALTNTSNITVSGLTATASPQFSVTQDSCTGSLAAGSSCLVAVAFAPTASGAQSGVLTLSSPAVTTPATVLLTGSGATGAAVQITPGAIEFATTPMGSISAQTPVTVTNTGASASLNSLALSVSAGFLLVNNTCGATLAPGASCTAGVEFAPTSGGAQTGSLTVTSSSATGASIPLSGLAFDFTLAVSGSSSPTVSSGQTASYTLAIIPLDGSQGTFTFQCGTLPANAICTFNPPSEALNGAAGTVSVQISTGGGGSSARVTGSNKWRLLPLVCGLVLLPFGLRRRPKALLLPAVLAIFVAGVSSCTSSGGGTGGGSGGNSGGSSTPAGTYTIPVTAAANGVQHSVSLTLTVD